MAVTALIVFEQNSITGPAGRAYEGTVADGVVLVANDDNTNVASWRVTLLDVPPDSALVPGVLASADSGTPAASFTPDVAGSYRIYLEVFDAISFGGTTDKDIRNFGIRNARGFIVPPYQKLPDPLPVLGSGQPGEKPDEQNYGGQTRGWSGDRTDGQLEEFFQVYDDLPIYTVTSTPFSAAATGEQPVYFVSLVGAGTFNLPSGARTGQRFRVIAASTVTLLTVAPPGGHTIGGLASMQMFGGTSGVFLYLGGTVWMPVGAKQDKYERTLVASVESTDLTGFDAIGSTIINPSDLVNISQVTWEAIIETNNVADAAEVRLYNVTLGAAVAGSTLSTSNLTPTLVTATVTLAAGANLYEAQLRLMTTGTPNRATCKQAQLIINWLQP
jgi:hypothetical protein